MAFLSVASRDDVPPMRTFVEEFDLGGLMPHVADVSGEVWARFGVAGQPAWVFVDDDGTTETIFGALSQDELSAKVQALRDT